MTIHVAHIDHRHGYNFYVAATEDELSAKIAEYCREYWDDCQASEDTPEAPEDNNECVSLYFDENEEEFLAVDTATLDSMEVVNKL